jgi:hypothetical protein
VTREELIAALRDIAEKEEDPETDHVRADELLLQYINAPEIRAAFEAVDRYYS